MREYVGDPAFTVDDDTPAVAMGFRLVAGEDLDLAALLRAGPGPGGRPMSAAPRPPALIPSSARSLPMAVSAKGARIFDEAGLDYIDASSGPLAVTLGHGHPRVLAAIADQFSAVDYVHRTQFRNSAAERLAGLVTSGSAAGSTT